MRSLRVLASLFALSIYAGSVTGFQLPIISRRQLSVQRTKTVLPGISSLRLNREAHRGPNRGPHLQAEPKELIQDDSSIRENVAMANVCMKVLYFILATTLLFLSNTEYPVMWSEKYAGAAGFYVASALSHIIARAARHDRLSSDTYKRLNLGLLGFVLVSLLAIPGEAGYLVNPSDRMVLLAASGFIKGFGAIVAFLGWKEGCKGAKCYFQEFFEGVETTFRHGFKTFSRGIAYRNLLLAVMAGMLINAKRLVDSVRLGHGVFRTSLSVSALGRLFMMSTILFCQKDAGERNRLHKTTFVHLNWLLFVWTFVTGLGDIIDSGFGLSPYRLNMFHASIYCLFACVFREAEKDGKLSWIEDRTRFFESPPPTPPGPTAEDSP